MQKETWSYIGYTGIRVSNVLAHHQGSLTGQGALGILVLTSPGPFAFRRRTNPEYNSPFLRCFPLAWHQEGSSCRSLRMQCWSALVVVMTARHSCAPDATPPPPTTNSYVVKFVLMFVLGLYLHYVRLLSFPVVNIWGSDDALCMRRTKREKEKIEWSKNKKKKRREKKQRGKRKKKKRKEKKIK